MYSAMNVDLQLIEQSIRKLAKTPRHGHPFQNGTQCTLQLARLYLCGGADVFHKGRPVGMLQHFALIQGPANAAECN